MLRSSLYPSSPSRPSTTNLHNHPFTLRCEAKDRPKPPAVNLGKYQLQIPTIIAYTPEVITSMPYSSPRIKRESRTIKAMIALHCHGHHWNRTGLCPDCAALLAYSLLRLQKCPFQKNKPACGLCLAHCYNLSMREKIQSVMRYSGPRMLYRHPILTLLHMKDRLTHRMEQE
jgi:hypothetical protein